MLKKPKIPEVDIWDAVATQDLEQCKAKDALKVFLFAPDNGFLLWEILIRFESMSKNLKDGIQPSENLKKYINTASWIRKQLDENFPESNKDFFHLRLSSYLKELARINKRDINREEWIDYIHKRLFHGYKEEHTLYVSLFYPFYDSTAYSGRT
ncbi:hypothetical protein CYQ88_03770 [Hydrogenovibrio sp. SC-1]|uniref:hypothetical protein n=1 Tax=Hydrogenovibrio sp. SC-1 TaxID=2065820 RepID=UPI000C7E856E|nr:hypothetical protein [Hydrogenovibrio sp. SC-1]PLA75027.1 hypothetical protein CYQ88_03770 [Hydrogenovibrio sp. SC-1]